MGTTDYLIAVFAALLAVPAVIFVIECLCALFPVRKHRDKAGSVPRPGTVVVVPAHNEADGLGNTLEALKPELGPSDLILVVADNCTDATADVARTAGVQVIERNEPELRGKGYAIAFAIRHLKQSDRPDVVIIVDADCQMSAGGIETLARVAHKSGRPVQADYLLEAAGSDSPKKLISAFAILIRNRVRPRGLRVLGLPCHMTGSGMAFPWDVLLAAPGTESNLVEDMQMGIDLALLGFPPVACSEVRVTSPLPVSEEAGSVQRRRWEHGHLATIKAQTPRLLFRGITSGSPALISMGLDLLVPPLALLVMVYCIAAGAFGIYWMLTGTALPFVIVICAVAGIAGAVTLSWWRFGRHLISARGLIAIPMYLTWKIPLYIAYCLSGAHSEWERTRRDSE